MKTASPMKCKSWSNKINNFVVRRLKSIKVNGQPQQQILSPCSTMPAMPKEKATAVSLNESNFSELKLKELAINSNATNTNSNTNSNSISNNCNSNSTATATTTMATTATSRMQTPTHHLPTAAAAAVQSITAVTAATVTTTTQPHWAQRQTQQQQQQQQYTQSRNSLCGCGNVSAVIPETVGSLNHGSSRYLTNGHSSPLAAAMAANGVDTLSPDHAPTCCRYQQQQQEDQEQQQQQQQQHQQQQYLQHNGYNGTTEAAVGAANANAPTTNDTSAAINIISSAATLSANAGGASASSPTNVAVTPPKKTPNDYIFGKYIGEGSFSNVYLAVDVHTKREYAIKVCEKRHIIREDKQEYVRRERESLHMMTNVPGFVNLSCTFQDRRSLYFVMTYAKNGDLLPYINKVGSFDVDCTRHYVAELVLACEEMHSRNVVHRDLKPENILLDEDMHTLIADFGSAKIFTAEDRANFRTAFANGTTMSNTRLQRNSNNRSDEDEDDDTNDDTNDTGSDEDHQQRTSSSRHGRYLGRRRRGSFVGTAQYVSPEVVVNGLVTPAADLWALGCIVYQMISGLPPFRGSNDYSIFKDIISCNIDFPQGFDKDAEDLVRRLLKVQPEERLGAKDVGATYESIRQHPFFNGIDFNTVRQQTPPPIYPYLPGVSKDENFSSHYFMSQNLEPGLGDKQLTRLLGMELGTSLGSDDDECRPNGREIEKKTVRKNIYDLSESEKQIRLEQQKSDKWHVFADNEVILKKGYINKRKGLFARRRMLLLTTGPRLIYIDPVHMVKKGEIPWSPELRVEPKNFKIFFVHTPNRTYYLDDPDSYSLEWVDAIERMRKLTYPDCDTATAARTTATSFSTTATGTSPKSSHRTNSPTSLTNGSGSSSSGNMLSAAFAAVSIRTTKTASN